jgi:outer membrane protein assembly factor BamD (BamD/ComL family)
MNRFIWVLPLVAIFPLCAQEVSYAQQDGKIVSTQEKKKNSVQEHFNAATEAYEKKQWQELVRHASTVLRDFPTTPFSHEAIFYLGVGYYQLQEYELSNKHLSSYLKRQSTPRHFEEAIQLKFQIAEQFKGGAKKHLMGVEQLPKWVPAKEDAVAIYDEVITALPHHELGARAIFSKAEILFEGEDFKEAVEAYQTLIRRFPKHPLAVESYLGIGNVYLTQCQKEYPDPDFLDLAELNLKKFRSEFPGEARVSHADVTVLSMKEIYAQALYETGQFFERTKKPHAALIYYQKILSLYEGTKTAGTARERLVALKTPEKTKAVVEEPKQEVVQQAPAVENQEKPVAVAPAAEQTQPVCQSCQPSPAEESDDSDDDGDEPDPDTAANVDVNNAPVVK